MVTNNVITDSERKKVKYVRKANTKNIKRKKKKNNIKNGKNACPHNNVYVVMKTSKESLYLGKTVSYTEFDSMYKEQGFTMYDHGTIIVIDEDTGEVTV